MSQRPTGADRFSLAATGGAGLGLVAGVRWPAALTQSGLARYARAAFASFASNVASGTRNSPATHR